MRSFPAILLAALTVVVITVSVVLTASHFGMRDWPTPPMPDTAKRLITPTEAAAKRERLSKGDDPAEVTIAGDAGADSHRVTRPTAQGSTRRAGTRSHRAASRRGDRSGERRSGNRHSGGDQTTAQPGDDTAATPAPSQPATPPAGPSAPVTEAG